MELAIRWTTRWDPLPLGPPALGSTRGPLMDVWSWSHIRWAHDQGSPKECAVLISYQVGPVVPQPMSTQNWFLHFIHVSEIIMRWMMAQTGPDLLGVNIIMVTHGSTLGSMDRIFDQVGQVVPLFPNVTLLLTSWVWSCFCIWSYHTEILRAYEKSLHEDYTPLSATSAQISMTPKQYLHKIHSYRHLLCTLLPYYPSSY